MAPSTEVAVRPDAGVTPSIDPDQSLKASRALLAHLKKAAQQKAAISSQKSNSLLYADDGGNTILAETPVWLVLSTKRHISGSARLKPHTVVLPHSFNTDPELRICVISADPQRAYKNLVASDSFPREWRKRITRVIGLSKLKSKFKQYQAQRKLLSEHDVFLADDRIINRLPNVLGKTFFKSGAKRPIPVHLQTRRPKQDGKRVKPVKSAGSINACTPEELAGEVRRAVGSAVINLSPSTNTAVRVGYAAMTAQQIAENVRAVATSLVEKYIPQKWQNVRSIYLKGPETASLPIWLTDELWLEHKDVVADDSEEIKALMPAEKANVGKKRKSVDGPVDDPLEEVEPVSKKVKATKTKELGTDIAEQDELETRSGKGRRILKLSQSAKVASRGNGTEEASRDKASLKKAKRASKVVVT